MTRRSPACRAAVVFVGLAALATLPLLAQAPPPSAFLQLNVVTLKPGMAQAYIDFQKSEVIPALQKSGMKRRDSWRTAIFGDTYQVTHVTEISGFDQYDSPSPFRKMLGDAGYAAYVAKASTMVSAQRTYAIRTRPDLSYFADPTAQPKMAILTTVDVKADSLLKFESFIKGEWIAALKKGGGTYYAVSQVVYGGNTTEYLTLVGVNSFAEIGKGHPVTRALSEEGLVKLMATSGAFANKIERTIIRLDPDLSFQVK